MKPDHTGLAVVVAGPSGSGKSTLCKRLCQRPGYRFSVSATTRPPRAGERDGVEYHFVTRQRFDEMRDRGELLEWSEHFDNAYGTPRRPVEEAIAAGEIVILDIDVNGADQVRRAMPAAKRIFICPPSREVLEQRLRGRHTEDEAALQKRLARADMELSRAKDFDTQIVNGDLDRATEEMAHWIEAEVKRSHGSRTS
ncbi:MAG TPA: guanylate kinase [Candidatus Brocadiia bacterium]|nr:guanylate kinase [Candidatus Brocadiia bacterium]